MCIIIYSPGGYINKKHLVGSLENNRDGWGVMWPENHKVQIVQGLTRNQFFHNWTWIKKKPGPKVFHARISTHGAVNIDNCHPFMVPSHGQLAMAHNGVIFRQANSGPHSDTKNFVRNILAGLPVGFQEKYEYQELIGEYIGQSKLVFMDGEGNVDIINVDAGHWKDKVWYSNYSYSYYKSTQKTGSSCYVKPAGPYSTSSSTTNGTSRCGMSCDMDNLPSAYLPKDGAGEEIKTLIEKTTSLAIANLP